MLPVEYIVLLLIILSSCKAPKIISGTTTSKDIKVTERQFNLSTDLQTSVHLIPLEELSTGHTITRTDKKTGITTRTHITQKEVVTVVDVPPISKTIAVQDTSTITNNRSIVQEEKYNLWDKLNDLINLVVWLLVIFFIISLVLKLIK